MAASLQSLLMAPDQSSPEGLPRWTGVVTVLLALVGWSSIPLFLRYFVEYIDAWTSNGWRYGFSALFWSPVLVVGLARKSLPRGVWLAALWPSLINCASQVVFCWAHYKIEPGLLAFGLRSNIVFTTVGAALMFASERRVIRTPAFLTGVLLVVGGTTGTVLMGRGGLPEGSTLFGVVLAIAAGAGFAGYALAVRRWMHGFNAVHSFAVISLYTAAGMVGLMVLLGERHGLVALDLVGMPIGDGSGAVFPFDLFGMLLLSALIGIALGHVAYYYSIAKLGVAVSSGVIQLQPFFVSIASLAIFGERLTPLQWGAGTVAVLGAVLILLVQHTRKHRAAGSIACPACGYDLRGLGGPVCPECGEDAGPRDGASEYAELPPDHVAAASAAEREPQ